MAARSVEDVVMEPRTVWGVRVGAPETETEGRLSLDQDDLVFSVEEGDLRLPLARVRKVKRVRGSPVLTVDHETDGKLTRYAFFFVKPPALHPQGNDSKRKTRRKSMAYLTTSAGTTKEDLIAWEHAVREAAAAKRG
jgi:hypothetical protein